MLKSLIKLEDLNFLKDGEETKYSFFNGLSRKEKLKLINFENKKEKVLIFSGNHESNIKKLMVFFLTM